MRSLGKLLTLVLLVPLPLAWSAGLNEQSPDHGDRAKNGAQISTSQEGVETAGGSNAKKRNAETQECRPSPGEVPPLRIYAGVRSNSGWNLMLNSGQSLSKIETRPLGHSIWTPAQVYGDSFGAAFAELPQCAKIEVRATTANNRELGPYVLTFDAMASVRKQAMQSVRTTPGSWAYLRAYPDENHSILYFTHLASYRCGLHEVRYSVDSEALDKRLQLTPCSFDDPFALSADDHSYTISLPEKHDFVAVQVVFVDNTTSDVVIKRRGSGG
jgi:hypothetical protein